MRKRELCWACDATPLRTPHLKGVVLVVAALLSLAGAAPSGDSSGRYKGIAIVSQDEAATVRIRIKTTTTHASRARSLGLAAAQALDGVVEALTAFYARHGVHKSAPTTYSATCPSLCSCWLARASGCTLTLCAALAAAKEIKRIAYKAAHRGDRGVDILYDELQIKYGALPCGMIILLLRAQRDA